MAIQLSLIPASGVNQPDFARFGQGLVIELPHKSIHEAFRMLAAKFPLAIAVEHDGSRIIYGELDLASTNLSNRLIMLGLRPRNRVVLIVQRSIPMIIAILAILKSGCQYVPMDGGIVADHALAHVLSEVEPPMILCLQKYAKKAKRLALPGMQVLYWSYG